MKDFKWDERFLVLSRVIASFSKDPSSQVGAVIVRRDNTIAAMGFNGLPRGVEDTHERLCDRKLKYPMVVHAEANALASAKESVEGYTLYCTHPPCANCAGLIIQSGIKCVVANEPTGDMVSRWGDSFTLMQTMFHEAKVDLAFLHTQAVLRRAFKDGIDFLQKGAS